MRQHLIALDLDGTTLNQDSKLTRRTIEVLRQLHQIGHMVCIITGRPYRTSKEIYQQLNIPTAIVNFNGALCHLPNQPLWLPYYHLPLDKEIAFDIFSHQEELSIDLLMAEGKDKLFTTSMNVPDNPYYPTDKDKLVRLSRDNLSYDPTALLVFCPRANQEVMAEKLRINYPELIDVRTWGGPFPVLEIIRAGVNKAVGLQKIANFYHIPSSHIIAIGDEENDIEMLQYAGISVAMKNATPIVKNTANHITEYTNHEDGVAEFLANYFSI